MREAAGAVPRVEVAPGYTVSRVIHGAWQLSAGHRGTDAADREAAIEGLLRLAGAGFTTFDCADIYTGVEELLGEVIRRWRARHSGTAVAPDLQVHTKLVPDRAALPTLTRAYVERVVDRSLSRLGVERLDLVQLHWWDYEVPGYVEAAGWLDELRQEGKVRCVGATNFDRARLAEILDAGVPVVSLQLQYSLLDRRPEDGMTDLARERGLGLLCYGTLAGGFLSERWLGAPEPEAPATELPNRSLTKYRLIQQEWGSWALFQELLATLHAIGARHRTALSTVALAWVLERPGVSALVLGASGARHLAATRRAFELALSAEDRAQIDAVLARARGPRGEVYGLERIPGGRHAAIMRYDLNAVAPTGGATR